MDGNTFGKVNWLEKLSQKLKIRKPILLYVVFPLIVVGLLIFGLVQQGIIGGVRTAILSVYVVDESQKPIVQAIIEAGSLSGITNADGRATITGDLAARKETVQVSVRKTGYIPHAQSFELKSGENDLGTVTLKESPVAKVDIKVRVESYISEEVINDAVVALTDIGGIFTEGFYSLTGVPVGTYSLTVSRTGYKGFATNVTVAEDTVELDKIQLVPSGVVVFESNRDRGKRGIFTSNYDGGDQLSLVKRVGDLEDYTPVLGPNQRKLFFTSTRDGEKRPNDPNTYREYMYLVDVDGNNLTKISETSSSYAIWSPDGGYIGFTKYNDNYSLSSLYTYDVVGKKLNQFVGYNSSNFAFSSDGKQIVFHGKKEGFTENRLFFSNSNATEITEIANSTVNYYQGLEFTGDGKIRYSFYDSSAQKNRWFEYTIAGGAIVEITAPAIDRDGAVLSPDKKFRAYVSTRDGKTNLYISGTDGKNEKKLTDINNLVSGDLLWSKDSSFLMFNFRKSDESARYLVSVNGTAPPKKIVDVNLTYYY